MTEQELAEIKERLNDDSLLPYTYARLKKDLQADIAALIAEVRRLQGELEERDAFLERGAIALTGSGTNEEVLLRIDALFNKRGKQDAT